MDLSRIIKTFSTPGVRLFRAKEHVQADGFYTEPDYEGEELREVSVQPSSARDLVHVGEGRRSDEVLKLYTIQKLYSDQDPDGNIADFIEFEGERYEVQHTEKSWGKNANYYKSLAVKVPN